MSGIYIPGMEMPQPGEAITIFCSGDAHRFIIGMREALTKSKAIPVPPHGRLGDLDAALKKLNRICLPDDLSYTIGHDIAKQFLKDAPTIIPASEEGE